MYRIGGGGQREKSKYLLLDKSNTSFEVVLREKKYIKRIKILYKLKLLFKEFNFSLRIC